jgi:hypothetical protein
VRRFGLVALAALAFPSAAGAHIEPKPPFVNADTTARIELETPNERKGVEMTGLVVQAPPGVTLVDASSPPGWRAATNEGGITFSGGRLAPGETELFATTVRADTPGTSTLRAVQRFADGAEVPWEVELSVLPAAAATPPKQHPERALLAAIVGVLAVALSLLLLHRLRRRSLQES